MPIRLHPDKPSLFRQDNLSQRIGDRAAVPCGFLVVPICSSVQTPVRLRRDIFFPCKKRIVEQVAGIEPAPSAWRADVVAV